MCFIKLLQKKKKKKKFFWEDMTGKVEKYHEQMGVK